LAIILGQLLFWFEKVRAYDECLLDEYRALSCGGSAKAPKLRDGWIYKKASDLISETMLSISEQTMRRHLIALVDAGWVEARNNPENKWDKVLQYKPNLAAISKALNAIGYALQGYVIPEESVDVPPPPPSKSGPSLGKDPVSSVSGVTVEANALSQASSLSKEVSPRDLHLPVKLEAPQQSLPAQLPVVEPLLLPSSSDDAIANIKSLVVGSGSFFGQWSDTHVQGWLLKGYDVEGVILPTIEKLMRRNGRSLFRCSH
jgi:DNA-binding transcriptional ArsR family regulator